MALPKKNRLSKKKDIDKVFKEGVTVRSSFLFIKVLKTQKDYSRFAFIIPARFIRLAIDRNRAKRVLSEEVKSNPMLKSGYDVVVVICKKVERSSIKNLAEDLNKVLTKIR